MSQIESYLANREKKYLNWFDQCLSKIDRQIPAIRGVLTRISGLALEAKGIHCKIGTRCQIISNSEVIVEAEVVGFSSGNKYSLILTNP